MKKKDLSSKVDSLLNGLVGRLEKLEKVTVEQFPEVCREIIAERKTELQGEIVIYGLESFIAISVLVASAIFGLSTGASQDMRMATTLTGSIALMLGAIAIIALANSLLSIRMLKVAPKLYVLRELRSMISDNEE